MNAKTILLSLMIALVIVAAVFAVAFFAMPGFSSMVLGRTVAQQQYVPGQGHGMMGGGPGQGRGMMGGGYNQQTAPNSSAPSAANTPVAPSNSAPSVANTPVVPSNSAPSAASTPVAPSDSAPSQGRGRGMMGGSTQPAGSLVAVSPDGKTIPATTKLPENMAAQTVGKLNVTIALTPYPPVSFQTGNFEITLTDEKGQAINDAKISLDLTMPGMWMPPSKPNASSIGDGKYKASAPWTMRGLWRIQVIIERGSEKSSAFFDVWL